MIKGIAVPTSYKDKELMYCQAASKKWFVFKSPVAKQFPIILSNVKNVPCFSNINSVYCFLLYNFRLQTLQLIHMNSNNQILSCCSPEFHVFIINFLLLSKVHFKTTLTFSFFINSYKALLSLPLKKIVTTANIPD